MIRKKSQSGFTLVELSMVIVVIALIIGGIVVGSNIIASSRLQSVIADVNRYKTAVGLFRERYLSLPGDISGATLLWGSKTTNGDGDGHIGNLGTPQTIVSPAEQLLVWQHLSLAELIPGYYDANPAAFIPGENVPVSRYKSASYTLSYAPPQDTGTNAYVGTYGNILVFGSLGTSAAPPTTSTPYWPVLKPSEAYSLDQKIDDGLPASGNVMTFDHDLQPNCVSDDTSAAIYLKGSSVACSLIFITGF